MVRTLSKQEIEEYITEIVNRVIPVISPEKIYLFGSFAAGDYDKDSDIDLCFVVENSKSLPAAGADFYGFQLKPEARELMHLGH